MGSKNNSFPHLAILSFLIFISESIPLMYGCYLMKLRNEVFTGIFGDNVGYMALSREILNNNVYPFYDPFDPLVKDIPLIVSPLFYWLCGFFSILMDIPVWVAYYFTFIAIDIFLMVALYSLFIKVLRNEHYAFFASILALFACSLSRYRYIYPIAQNIGIIPAVVWGIISGKKHIQIPLHTKMEFHEAVV